MLWVYGEYKYLNSYSAAIDFSRQNLTSTDVSFGSFTTWGRFLHVGVWIAAIISLKYLKSRTVVAMKWNESDFKPPLGTYRLSWAMRTSRGWWNEWDDTAVQAHDLEFELWWSEAEHATEAPHITESLRVSGKETFCFFETWRGQWGSNPR